MQFLELEVGEANIIASQKAAEASCIVAKFWEAQDTMKEADIMINELMIVNEKLKLDVERLKQTEIKLINERDALFGEVQGLQSSNVMKDQEFEILQKQFGLDLSEKIDLVAELESIITQLQEIYNNFMTIAYDCCCLKSFFLESTRSVGLCLEDIWSEIIAKDCAISVLHLCHMGILLETVTGLNAENGLLQHGLCESNSVISDLREHNFKAMRELEVCRNLKGKLLADFKSNFDRITRKEEEASELGAKLSSFEKKISDLKLQEELMLQRSNYMGSQLAMLMKDLDLSNANIMVSLLDQEKLLQDKEFLNFQAESLMINLSSKNIESLILASKFQEMVSHLAVAENELCSQHDVLENLKRDLIFSKVDKELKEQYLADIEVEAASLKAKANEAEDETRDLLSRLRDSSLSVTRLEEENKSLMQGIQSLKNVASSNDILKHELGEVKVKLHNQIQEIVVDRENLLKGLRIKEEELELSAGRISILEQENKKLQEETFSLETSSCKLQKELDMKALELSRMSFLEEENKSLKIDVQKLKMENSLVIRDLEEEKSKFESSLTHIHSIDIENQRLQEKLFSLESSIASIQNDLDLKNAELNRLQQSQSAIMEDLCLKSHDLQTYVDRVNTLRDENISLRDEVGNLEEDKREALTISSLTIAKCIHSVNSVDMIKNELFNLVNEDGFVIVDKWLQLMCENLNIISKFTEEVEFMEGHIITLQDELLRKDDILQGLLFDLRLLQESASNSKDQKDEMEEMKACLETLEEKLSMTSNELDEAVAHSQMLVVQLKEKTDMISTIELDIFKEQESLKLLSNENIELRAQLEDALASKCALEEEIKERRKMTESLEMELLEMDNVLGQMNDTTESLRSNLNELTGDRDQLQEEVLSLKERLENAEEQTKQIEAISLEAQQVCTLF